MSTVSENPLAREGLPLELFFPIPSLSMTSSLQRIRREVPSLISVRLAAGSSAALNLSVAGPGIADEVLVCSSVSSS